MSDLFLKFDRNSTLKQIKASETNNFPVLYIAVFGQQEINGRGKNRDGSAGISFQVEG